MVFRRSEPDADGFVHLPFVPSVSDASCPFNHIAFTLSNQTLLYSDGSTKDYEPPILTL